MNVFTLSLDQAELFYQLCARLNLNTEKERAVLLAEMAKAGHVLCWAESGKSKEEYVAHMAKHFKILKVDAKKEVPTDK